MPSMDAAASGPRSDGSRFMETTMKSISSVIKSGLICGTALVASAASSLAADIDYSRYFKSSTALSAISSAVSILEPCEKPIQFSEQVEKDSVTFSASCPSSDGEAITVKLSFQRDESGNLFPDSFDYAN